MYVNMFHRTQAPIVVKTLSRPLHSETPATGSTRNASIISVTYSNLYMLPDRFVHRLLDDFPEDTHEGRRVRERDVE